MGMISEKLKRMLPGAMMRVNRITQRLGVNITPNHFYSDYPDFNHLENTTYWRKPYSMFGINGAETGPQLEFAKRCCEPYHGKLAENTLYDTACKANGEAGFGPAEAEFLYCYVRSEKPPVIVQVGCGVSTQLILLAIDDEPDYSPQVVCVEPFPTDNLKNLDRAGRIKLHAVMAQEVDISVLTDLGDGGLLFVDSTHSVRVGSEVIRLISEVLPRLSAGSRVHFHDICYPYDYGPSILERGLFVFREHALLYAYLVKNPSIAIEASMSMLHHAEVEAMQKLLPNYKPCKTKDGLKIRGGHFPASTYMRVID